MQYKEFVCAIEKKMNKKLEGGKRATLYRTIKNNGTKRTGIMIETPKLNISPTIYLEEFYEYFQKGMSLETVTDEILKFYEDAKCEEPWDTSVLEDFGQIRKKIVYKLIHTKKNEELLRQIPSCPILDMSMVFYALLKADSGGTATMLITDEHLRMWHTDTSEILEAARENTISMPPPELYTMRETVECILHPASCKKQRNLLEICQTERTYNHGREKDGCDTEDYMYVLSNPLRSLGAGCVLYPHVLDKIGQIVGENFYVLPSSIHEIIIVPESFAMEPADMNRMVAEINQTQVAEEEVLSDNAYFYERKTKELTVCPGNGGTA